MSEKPILVTGAHRSGTTWVGKMLAASGEAAYISEPFNVLHRPGVFRTPIRNWYTYICKDNESEYLPAIRQMLAFDYHLGAEIASLKAPKDLLRMVRDQRTFLQAKFRRQYLRRRQRPLIKDPFALFSIPWLIDKLGCQVVVTIRHPAAFASSLKRLNWPFNFRDLLDQTYLMRDWLEPFHGQMEDLLVEGEKKGRPDMIAQGSLLWLIIYSVVKSLGSQPGATAEQMIAVRHEDLSLDPLNGYKSLYQSLGLNFSAAAQRTIQEASSSDNPTEVSSQNAFSVRLDSRANMGNWKKRLTPEEIQRIRLYTDELAAFYYPNLDWD